MTDAAEAQDFAENRTATRVPRHFWPVAAVSLLWNAFGAFDYLMTQTRNPAYLANFPPEMLTYMDSMPAWVVACWAFGVWGAFAGAVLLLMRSRHAVAAFAVSLAGLALSTIWSWGIAAMPESMRRSDMLAMNAVIWTGAIFLLVYAVKMRGRGVLR